jgi:hypothetical protein
MDPEIIHRIKSAVALPDTRASLTMKEAAAEWLERHQDGKAKHDPTAEGSRSVPPARPGQAVTAFSNKSSSCSGNGDTLSSSHWACTDRRRCAKSQRSVKSLPSWHKATHTSSVDEFGSAGGHLSPQPSIRALTIGLADGHEVQLWRLVAELKFDDPRHRPKRRRSARAPMH